jgi:hypothetical protein
LASKATTCTVTVVPAVTLGVVPGCGGGGGGGGGNWFVPLPDPPAVDEPPWLGGGGGGGNWPLPDPPVVPVGPLPVPLGGGGRMWTPYCVALGAATTLQLVVPVIVAVVVSVTVKVSVPIALTVAWKVAMPFLKVTVTGTVAVESEHVTVAVPELLLVGTPLASIACTTTVIVVPEMTFGIELGVEEDCPSPGPCGPMGAGGKMRTDNVAAAAVDGVVQVVLPVAPLVVPLVDPLGGAAGFVGCVVGVEKIAGPESLPAAADTL